MTTQKRMKWLAIALTVFTFGAVVHTYISWTHFAQNRTVISQMKSSTNSLSRLAYEYVVGDEGSRAEFESVTAVRGADGGAIVSRFVGVDATVQRLAEKAMRLSAVLADAERQAFDIKDEGNIPKAMELVFGNKYRMQKDEIMEAIEEAEERLVTRGRAGVTAGFVTSAVSLAISIAILLLSASRSKRVAQRAKVAATFVEMDDELEMFRQFFEQAPLGFIIMDDKGNIEQVNPTFSKVFGYDHDDLEGKHVNALLLEDDRASHMSKAGPFIADSKAKPITQRPVRGRSKQGGELDVLLSVNKYHYYDLSGVKHNRGIGVVYVTPHLEEDDE